ncbi:hypothetical protein Q9Q99_10995 [Curtobacterium flaccumfaciens]|nr:hypothetical protein Q9Q99_10995 [Curtobacterium flaccumfaciens]
MSTTTIHEPEDLELATGTFPDDRAEGDQARRDAGVLRMDPRRLRLHHVRHAPPPHRRGLRVERADRPAGEHPRERRGLRRRRPRRSVRGPTRSAPGHDDHDRRRGPVLAADGGVDGGRLARRFPGP